MNTVQEMNEKCYINADSPTAMNYLGMKMYEFIKRAVDMGYKSIVFI